MAVQWLHAAQAPVRPRHCPQALLQQPDQLILSNTLPRPAARALFSLRLHSVSIAFRLCASSGESSARLRRFDWVFCALSRSWFEGVSSARLRRINWVFCARRRAASVGSVGWSGEVHPGGVVLPRVVGMMGPKRDAGGNRAKVMSTDRHRFFALASIGGVVLDVPCRVRVPQNITGPGGWPRS